MPGVERWCCRVRGRAPAAITGSRVVVLSCRTHRGAERMGVSTLERDAAASARDSTWGTRECVMAMGVESDDGVSRDEEGKVEVEPASSQFVGISSR